MGSECRSSKFHYDIGMSKRTRRPSDFKKDNYDNNKHVIMSGFDGEGEDEAQENENRKSLKEFIQGRSLYQHFSEEEEEEEEKEEEKEKEKKKEENELKLVKVQKDVQQQGFNGRLKFKSLVSLYGKVLSQLIKIKRNTDAFPKKSFPK